jgi:hypothetical protein
MTIFYCLKFETLRTLESQCPVFITTIRMALLCPQALDSIFLTSYDSQSYGEGIRTHLHTTGVQSYITTDGQSPSLSWHEALIWGLRPDLYYCQLRVCWCGALSLSLWREDGSVWPSTAQSFSGPSPVGLRTIICRLRFETPLFVASYDSQGYSGSIRPPRQWKKSKDHLSEKRRALLISDCVSVRPEVRFRKLRCDCNWKFFEIYWSFKDWNIMKLYIIKII